LQQAREELQKDELRAPWGGIVVSVEAAPGAIVGTGTPVLTLLDTTNLQFHKTNLSERDLTQLRPDQAAEIVLKSYPDQRLQGTIAGIGAQPSVMIGDAAVFPVRIDLAANDLEFRPGMTGRAEIRSE
jgi:multidrug resistance efflux pump